MMIHIVGSRYSMHWKNNFLHQIPSLSDPYLLNVISKEFAASLTTAAGPRSFRIGPPIQHQSPWPSQFSVSNQTLGLLYLGGGKTFFRRNEPLKVYHKYDASNQYSRLIRLN